MFKPGLILGAFALVALLLLSWVQATTRDTISENREARRLQQLQRVIPPAYGQVAVNERQQFDLGVQGFGRVLQVYPVMKAGQHTANVIEIDSLQGYSGLIRVLVAVNANQQIAGAQVLEHRETPGLGDFIDSDKSDWITQFIGASLMQPTITQWSIKKRGGQFDQLTGATISSMAVLNAVRQILELSTASAARGTQ